MNLMNEKRNEERNLRKKKEEVLRMKNVCFFKKFQDKKKKRKMTLIKYIFLKKKHLTKIINNPYNYNKHLKTIHLTT